MCVCCAVNAIRRRVSMVSEPTLFPRLSTTPSPWLCATPPFYGLATSHRNTEELRSLTPIDPDVFVVARSLYWRDFSFSAVRLHSRASGVRRLSTRHEFGLPWRYYVWTPLANNRLLWRKQCDVHGDLAKCREAILRADYYWEASRRVIIMRIN